MQDRDRLGLSIGVGLVASAGVFILSLSEALAVSAAVGYAGGAYLLSDALGATPSRLDEFSFLTSRKFLVTSALVSILLLSTISGIESSEPTTDGIALYTVLLGIWLFFAGYGAVFRDQELPDSRGEPRGTQPVEDGIDD